MKVRTVSVVSGFILALASFGIPPAVTSASTGQTPLVAATDDRPWMNTALPPENRARLGGGQRPPAENFAMAPGAASPPNTGSAGPFPANPRLGIPALYLADSP